MNEQKTVVLTNTVESYEQRKKKEEDKRKERNARVIDTYQLLNSRRR